LPIDANSITALRQKNKTKRNLDIIVGFARDDTAVVSGMPGTECCAARGMHGNFTPIDVHNTLIAFGPPT
jgi:hypothetical protein